MADGTVTHTVTGTHVFATTPEFQHVVACTHAFVCSNSSGGPLSHLVVLRHEFVCPNGDLANGRYRR